MICVSETLGGKSLVYAPHNTHWRLSTHGHGPRWSRSSQSHIRSSQSYTNCVNARQGPESPGHLLVISIPAVRHTNVRVSFSKTGELAHVEPGG